MAVDVYVNFRGNCREALDFYAKIFGSVPKIMTFGDAPPNPNFPIAEEVKKLIMNSSLNINGSNVMFSDVPPDRPFAAGNNISLVLAFNSIDQVQSIFNQLKEGGRVDMELQATFWTKCYGFLVDKFGIGWQIMLDTEQA